MDYTNVHNVRYKITEDKGRYTVKYYSNASKWPRIYQKFNCPDDETRREMFYILNNSRLCTLCSDELVDENRSMCQFCLSREASRVSEDQIADCPVCYNKMFRVNNTRKKLVCGHELCRVCSTRLTRPYASLIPSCTIQCPLCRHIGWYDYSLQILAHDPPTH